MADPAAAALTPPASRTRLRVLVFTDVAGSVDLKRKVGDTAYGRLIARHDAIFRSLLAATPGAEILNDTGDGFLAAFETASAAVDAAIRFQDALASEPWDGGERLRVRVGVHQGEVQSVDAGGSREKVVGLAADVAARVMGLAAAGQILLTRSVFDDARQVLRSTDRPLAWRAYGRYLLQGVEDPVEVHGVGREGELPSDAPKGSDKARRAVAADEEDTLGWRPAAGLEIPGRDGWRLERKLGEGGFGEVWLGVREKPLERRVFKFCFDADRLRSFRREITLVKLLRSALGDRADIARLIEIRLDRPPYYLESEFTEEGDLADWAARNGGIAAVPLATRLDLVARVADAVAAAHSVGILHKDLKPSNVLIYLDRSAGDATPRPRLADFGIGILTDPGLLAQRDITASGFTVSQLGENESSRTGTRLYAPPESALGKPFTTQGDVYALGVLLFQMVVGDFERPIAQGWERSVADPVLREDVAACVEGDPERRLASAADLATRLRSLPRRRRARALRRLGVAFGALAGVAAVLLGVATVMYFREHDLRREADDARARAETALGVSKRATGQAQTLAAFLRETFLAVSPDTAREVDISMQEALDQAIERIERDPPEDPVVEASVRDTMGQTYFQLGKFTAAKAQFVRARELYLAALGPENPDTLALGNNLAIAHWRLGELAEAARLIRETIEIKKRVLPADDPDTLASLGFLALVVQDEGDSAEAARILRETIAAWERRGEGRSEAAIHARVNLADCLHVAGRLEEAEAAAREAEAVATEASGEDCASALLARSIRGAVLRGLGRLEEAVALLRSVERARLRLSGPDHPDVLTTRNALANALSDLERNAEAEEIQRDVLARSRASLGPEHASTLTYTGNLARTLQSTGRAAEAEPLLRSVLEIRRRTLGADHPDALVGLVQLGDVLVDLGRAEEAEPMLREAVTKLDEREGSASVSPAEARVVLGRCLGRLGRIAEARSLLEEGHARLEKALGRAHVRTRRAAGRLADLFEAMGQADDAKVWRDRAKGAS